MSKEIKEKCKMCRYYNDKQQYPDVEGQTTHSNCISIKCQYSKITKDMQIRSLTNKIADLEAKLADYNEIMNDYNIQNIAELDEFLAKYDFDEDEDGNIISQVVVSDQKYIDIGYFNTIYKENQQLKQQLAEKEKAFDLMSIVLCTGARDDLRKQIGQFTLRKQVKEFFLKQAKKELENGTK